MVRGTAPPGAAVIVAAGQPASAANATTVVVTKASGHGTFRAVGHTRTKKTVITVAALLPPDLAAGIFKP